MKATHGICRFCGCTAERACRVTDAPIGTCAWRDPDMTVCDAPLCTAEYKARLTPALAALQSTVCACEGKKRSGMSFCMGCWKRLPWEFAGALYTDALRGYAVYYDDAIAWLKENTDRLKARTA